MNTIEELDEKIYNIYQTAHKDRPYARLDPNTGVLGALWAEFDLLIDAVGDDKEP